MKIYIAGKVTGLNWQNARAKFAVTEQKLIDAGLNRNQIVNPLELGIPPETDWHEAMQLCLKNLRQCTAIFIQKDWRDSFGARREITLAHELRLDLYYDEQNDIETLKNLINAGV
jgi:hypothetical protein